MTGITSTGKKAIEEALKTNTTLKDISFGGNEFHTLHKHYFFFTHFDFTLHRSFIIILNTFLFTSESGSF